MSLQSLVSELQSLRRDLTDLSARVLTLESQLASATEARFTTPPASPLVVNYTGLASPVSLPPYPDSGAAVAVPATPASSAPATVFSGSSELNLTEAERIQLAQDAGVFLRQCLTGEQRGTSGRDRLRLSSRYYILFRDIGGRVYDPVQVHHSFLTIKPLVKRGNDLGRSVFIGWPTLWEARRCTLAAGFAWPPDVDA